MKKVIENMKKSREAGCSTEGILINAMTALINRIDNIGGWSVDVLDEEEILIAQHPDAGDGEYVV